MNKKINFSIFLGAFSITPFILAGIYYYYNYKHFIETGLISGLEVALFIFFVAIPILLISIITQIVRVILLKKKGLSFKTEARYFILTSLCFGLVAIAIFIYVESKSRDYRIEFRRLESEMAEEYNRQRIENLKKQN